MTNAGKKITISGKVLGPETGRQIIEAINNGNIAVVRKLLRAGIDPNIRDEDNQSLINIASRLGDLEILNTLLEKEALVNASTGDGRTALHVATKANHQHIVRRLLDVGASTMARTLSGLKPIDFAKYESRIWYMLKYAEIRQREKGTGLLYRPSMSPKKARRNW